jgi:hypothetical protein
MLTRISTRLSSICLVISVAALFIALGGVGYAASGGGFHLGQTNTVSKSTHITAASKKAATLVLANTGGQPALSLSVASGVAPFAVNSSTKVASGSSDI